MDQTEDPVQSNTSDKEDEFGDDSEERDEPRCGKNDSPMVNDQEDSRQIEENESRQVRFEENGECDSGSRSEDVENVFGSEDEEENKIPETNGVSDEQPQHDNDEEDDQEIPNTLRDSIVDSEVSEEGREEVEENDEKDILQKLKNQSQYDRASSFSSLSVNIGSTQQDSDSEHQTSTHATPDSYSDICEENFDKNSLENEENYEEEERGGYNEELEINEEENEQTTETQKRDPRLGQSCASSLHVQEDPDDNDNKSDSTVSLSEEHSVAGDGALNTSEYRGLQSTNGNEDVVEVEQSSEQTESREGNFDEKGEETDPDVEVKDVLEVFENRKEKDMNDEEFETVKQEPQPVVRDEGEEQTKVKKLGRIFQERENQNPTALFPKEMNQDEKSPKNVRRFREIFEHGEPLLSPAAHAHVPEEECTSPRPGIVKNLRDLFENPKNFEWKETVKSTAVVN